MNYFRRAFKIFQEIGLNEFPSNVPRMKRLSKNQFFKESWKWNISFRFYIHPTKCWKAIFHIRFLHFNYIHCQMSWMLPFSSFLLSDYFITIRWAIIFIHAVILVKYRFKMSSNFDNLTALDRLVYDLMIIVFLFLVFVFVSTLLDELPCQVYRLEEVSKRKRIWIFLFISLLRLKSNGHTTFFKDHIFWRYVERLTHV